MLLLSHFKTRNPPSKTAYGWSSDIFLAALLIRSLPISQIVCATPKLSQRLIALLTTFLLFSDVAFFSDISSGICTRIKCLFFCCIIFAKNDACAVVPEPEKKSKI